MRAPARITALLLAATAVFPAAGGEPVEVISPRADAVSVTIYRDLFALITETRTVDLPAGPVTLKFDGVVETLLPASAIVADAGRALEERNYDYDALTPNRLFEKSIGRQVLLTRTLPGSGKVIQTAATILAANQRGITLRTADGNEPLHCSGLPEQVTFEQIPQGLQTRPRLSVRLAAGTAGKRQVRVSYLAHGFAWKSDYVARLDESGRHIELRGWLTLRNFTEASFKNAQVQVVAGKLNLVDESDRGTSLIGDTGDYGDEETLRDVREEALAELAEDLLGDDSTLSLFSGCFPVRKFRFSLLDAGLGVSRDAYVGESLAEVVVTGLRASQMAQRESLADYQLYRLPWPTDLNARQTKQAAFLEKRAVKVERFYRHFFNAADYIEEEDEPATPLLVLGFDNRKSAGLGEPLPEGVLRLFEAGPNGELFSGEGRMRDTAVGVPSEIPLAGAIDLGLEISVDAGEEIADAHIRIANAKGVPVTVEIRQQLDEYMAGAEITRASQRTLRKFGDFAWRVRVPANSADTLTYRLRVPRSDDSGE